MTWRNRSKTQVAQTAWTDQLRSGSTKTTADGTEAAVVLVRCEEVLPEVSELAGAVYGEHTN